ncbi:hypothetical protein ACI3L3_12155 [Desulfobaculum sp. SPO524]|uniref:hypothetical protein n=1 Tax=Desulfobaculum sp. SPO524 TaxID=3378071 RepID=UPI0038548D07
MKRREFFSRILGGFAAAQDEDAPQPLSERELFMRAMAMGIDPATVTPGQLRELVPDAEPQSTRADERQHSDGIAPSNRSAKEKE